MPRGDRTGPDGKGSGTGRGQGHCSGSRTPGYQSDGQGLNRGAGGGTGRGAGTGRSFAGGRGGRGRRNTYKSTGLTRWQRLFDRFTGRGGPEGQ